MTPSTSLADRAAFASRRHLHPLILQRLTSLLVALTGVSTVEWLGSGDIEAVEGCEVQRAVWGALWQCLG